MPTHWKKIVKPDAPYFGEQDFENIDEVKVVTIKRHNIETVINEKGKSKKGILYFQENVKPFILNVTNGKAIEKLYGKDIDSWNGKKIALYYDPTVKVAGKVVGGTRVKAPPQERTMPYPKCEMCGNDIKPAANMSPEQYAAYTKANCGQALCNMCARKKAQEVKNNVIDE